MACRRPLRRPLRRPQERRPPAIPEVFRKKDRHRDSWVTDPALQRILEEGLAASLSAEVRLRLTVEALTGRLDPVCVRACLRKAGVHPATLALATQDVRIQEGLARFLKADGETWSVRGDSLWFTGSVLPMELVVPGTLVLDDCPGDIELPEDLEATTLVYQNCRTLRRVAFLPVSVQGLRIENAPELVELPDSLELMSSFQLSACPRLEHLPSYIHASEVRISHCPGIRSIWARIRCRSLSLDSLINLGELDLELATSQDLELRLPSLWRLRGKLRVAGRVHIASPWLRSLEADLKASGDLLVEYCGRLEAIVGKLHVGGSLYLRRNPSLVSVAGGAVVGTCEFQDLPALRWVDPALVTSGRKVRFERCENLRELPYGITYRGSLELLDLPSLSRWPANMEVGLLTALGCPLMPEPPPGVLIRSAFRRVGPGDREALAQALEVGTAEAQAALAGLRLLVRVLKASNVSLKKCLSLLQEDGEDPAAVLVAAAAEGLGLRDFLDSCAMLADGPEGLLEAARACARASIHPGSLALVVRDRTKARWMAECLSTSKDLALGLRGDGNLRLGPEALWDLPEGLRVPGVVKVEGGKGPVYWPKGLQAEGGFSLPVERFLGEREASAT